MMNKVWNWAIGVSLAIALVYGFVTVAKSDNEVCEYGTYEMVMEQMAPLSKATYFTYSKARTRALVSILNTMRTQQDLMAGLEQIKHTHSVLMYSNTRPMAVLLFFNEHCYSNSYLPMPASVADAARTALGRKGV